MKLELEIDFKKLGAELAKHDFVEVVRCRDCAFYEDMLWCRKYGDKEPEWFCADGERKEINSR